MNGNDVLIVLGTAAVTVALWAIDWRLGLAFPGAFAAVVGLLGARRERRERKPKSVVGVVPRNWRRAS